VRRLESIKLYSDEKQFTRLFISVFASLSPTIGGLVVAPHGPWGGGWALRLYAGIGMTINLPGHLKSVAQHYFNHK